LPRGNDTGTSRVSYQRISTLSSSWTQFGYSAPVNPGAYAAAALTAEMSMAHCAQIIAQHKETQTAYTKYLGAQEAGKELLLYGIGDDALAPLKKQ
jgi:hypothetical protein